MATREVLLVNPNLMRPPIAPLGLEYLAPSLEARGYRPVLCDLTFAADWRGDLRAALDAARPEAVLVTIRNLDDAYFASQDFILATTTDIVREAMAACSAPVVLGGIGFSIAPEAVLRFTGSPYGIDGEGEDALPDLLDCLASGGEVASVAGAVYRVGDRVEAVPPRPCDLENMPAPSRRFLDNPRYFAEGGQAGIETKRGCARPCVYCVEPRAKGRAVRLRSPESVADEFADLLDQGIDAVHLCDSEFNLPAEHARAVCEALISRGLGPRLRWYTYAFPVPFDNELAETMKRAGCVGINFGVDHTDEQMLCHLGRDYTLEDIQRTVDACRHAGLAVMFDMLLGSPGETRETLAHAIDCMRQAAPDRVGLSCGVRVYPNTAIARLVREQGPLDENPNLHGVCEDNDDLLRPIFYVDAGIGGDIHKVVHDLVAGDKRFLHADPSELDGNYNYNDNSVLANAIRAGERGAYCDILRRLDEK